MLRFFDRLKGLQIELIGVLLDLNMNLQAAKEVEDYFLSIEEFFAQVLVIVAQNV